MVDSKDELGCLHGLLVLLLRHGHVGNGFGGE